MTMKNISLLLFCVSLSTLGFSQTQKYLLTTERTTQVLQKYTPGAFRIRTVIVDDVADSTKSKQYTVDSDVEDVASLNGKFTVIGRYYYQSYKDRIAEAYQLLDENYLKSKGVETYAKTFYPLLYSESNNQYYLDAGQISLIGECGTSAEVVEIISAINKAGYKTSDSNGKHIITTVNGNIILTSDILNAVQKGNTKYIDDISSSVKTFNQQLTQAQPLVDKLAGHYKAHRARTMTTDRLALWKQDFLKADGILKKMNSLKGAEKENITNFNEQFSTETLNKYNDFWGVVKGSKEVLGL
jgi:hypothetical protein